jgi:hypothetical protein
LVQGGAEARGRAKIGEPRLQHFGAGVMFIHSLWIFFRIRKDVASGVD